MKRRFWISAFIGCVFTAPYIANAQSIGDDFDRKNLPIPPLQKPTKVGPTLKESVTPAWPRLATAPDGAPNVLLIMTDDVGFGATTSFGGPVPTPTYDKLAARGLKYNNFNTTALCSPSRAALITGRNQHQAATGIIMELSTPFDGYNSEVPKSVGTIGAILTYNGYSTGWFGKNHNVPTVQSTPAGPYDLWPTGLGFEKFYGFLGADANQFAPPIYDGNVPVEPYIGHPDYILDRDLADHAIQWIQEQKSVSPGKPFLAYYTPGTSHAPHHAPKEWIDKFKGKFDMGWDVLREQTFERQKAMGIIPPGTTLNPTPPDYKRWDDLTPDMKKVAAREMEAYAGALSYADYQIGRLIDAIDKLGELDNTLIIYIQGDNGASAEDPSGQGITSEVYTIGNGQKDDPQFMIDHIDEFGTRWMLNLYSHGWAHAMNTPFQWDKKIASHLGGVRTSMVISWPGHIKDVGQMRSQFVHITDIVPTILEAAQIPAPRTVNGFKQQPFAGSSLVYTFDQPDAAEHHRTQYFEVIANRAIYHDGWWANTTPKRLPWVASGKSSEDPVHDYQWELYNMRTDFSQSQNLAASNPGKLKEMQALFMSEAKRNQVFPLDDRYVERGAAENRPPFNAGRKSWTYFPGTVRVHEDVAPNMKNGSWTMTANVIIPEGGANGIILTQGGYFGGTALAFLDGRPAYLYARSHYPDQKWKMQAPDKLTPGAHTVAVDFQYDGGGLGKAATVNLLVDGRQVATEHLPETVPVHFSVDEGLDVGEDTGTPVTRDYEVPFAFTGTIEKVVINRP